MSDWQMPRPTLFVEDRGRFLHDLDKGDSPEPARSNTNPYLDNPNRGIF